MSSPNTNQKNKAKRPDSGSPNASATDRQAFTRQWRELDREAATLLLSDRARVRGRLRKARDAARPGDLTRIAAFIEQAKTRKAAREQVSLTIQYPKELPVSGRAREIQETLARHQVVIVCGSTGSGKTTQLPKMLYEAGYARGGQIGCCQPRRLAAVTVARRVAEETKTHHGGPVGHKTRFDDRTSDETVIKFMTDGILLTESVFDKSLWQYGALVIDEAHERNLNIDFILGYVKSLLPRRPDLKVVISSATLDAEKFAEFFHGAPVIQVEGRTFPVDDYFLPPREDEETSAHVARAVKWISELDKDGDILVFLPGEREIRDTADTLTGRRLPNTEILPLFARLSVNEQQRAFQVGGRRRIVLATNVAETSVTIPGIHYVIDSGLVRLSRYNPRSRIQTLQVEQVSQASARQRRGRCGRIAEGVCVYLYDKETLEASPEHTDPEILRSALAGVILRMSVMGLPPIGQFEFIDPPNSALIREGYQALTDIGALDAKGRVTDEGRMIAEFPVDPHLAKILCQANREGALAEALVLVAYLSVQDPKERPEEQREAADRAHKRWNDERSDFISVLNLWNELEELMANGASQSRLRKFCRSSFLNYRRIREWRNLRQDLIDTAKRSRWNVKRVNGPLNDYHYDLLHRALLAGLPVNIGVYKENNLYQAARERQFYIFPGSGLFAIKPKWVMAFSLTETTRLFARTVAEIDPAWLEEVAPNLCNKSYHDIHWSPKNGFVQATETVSSGGLILIPGRRVHYGRVDPVAARKIFIRDGVAPGDINARDEWLERHRDLLKRIRYREEKIRRPDSLLDLNAIAEKFDRIIPKSVYTAKTLARWANREKERLNQLTLSEEDAMIPQFHPIDWNDYPDELEFYGHRFRLWYTFNPGEIDDGVLLACPVEYLGLLPDWVAQWMVPGFLPEKARLLIRSLPKEYRIACNPATDTAEAFARDVAAGKIDPEQHLLFALSDFLRDKTGLPIDVDDFDTERLPAFMTMNVAVIDENGDTLRYTRGLPDRDEVSTRLHATSKTVKRWTIAGHTHWPTDTPLPESVPLEDSGETKGYPALVDEGHSVGVHVFLDPREAAFANTLGMVRLFRLQENEQLAFYREHPPLTNHSLMTLATIDPDRRSLNDLVDAAIAETLTDEDRYEIRDAATFNARAEETRANLFDQVRAKGQRLDKLLEERDTIRRKLKPSLPDDIFDDIEAQLAFLFRPGFARSPMVWRRYARYLKALRIRLDRAILNPAKDMEKMAEVQPFQERLDAALANVDNPDNAFSVMEFAWLLQEFRITRFAPEVRAMEKVSIKRLEKAWDRVRRE